MDITMILLWVGIPAFGYFLLIRPGQRRVKEQQAMMASLAVGSRVMLASGIYGTVRYLGDRQVVLTISPGVDLTVLRQAVTKIVQPADEDFEYDSSDEPAIEGEPTYPVYEGGAGQVAAAAPDAGPGYSVPDAGAPGHVEPGAPASGPVDPGTSGYTSYTTPGYSAPDYSAPGYSSPHYETGHSDDQPAPQQPTDPQPPAEKN